MNTQSLVWSVLGVHHYRGLQDSSLSVSRVTLPCPSLRPPPADPTSRRHPSGLVPAWNESSFSGTPPPLVPRSRETSQVHVPFHGCLVFREFTGVSVESSHYTVHGPEIFRVPTGDVSLSGGGVVRRSRPSGPQFCYPSPRGAKGIIVYCRGKRHDVRFPSLTV